MTPTRPEWLKLHARVAEYCHLGGARYPRVAFTTVARFTNTQVVLARQDVRYRLDTLKRRGGYADSYELRAPDDPDVLRALQRQTVVDVANKITVQARLLANWPMDPVTYLDTIHQLLDQAYEVISE